MAKNKSNRAQKIQQRERAKKKAKQKKVLLICGCVVITAALAVLAVFMASRERSESPPVNPLTHIHGDSCRH
ncbi:MAG: hypothetical protein FWD48_03220 [Oscillospiraceae bacterium]|nr:hypothetical protein [Oscillospiraceae bacterium]